jgi:hypothetical protein
VAYLTMGGDHWQMFLFGFFTIFVITQMHGIGLGKKSRWGIVISYLLCVLFTYWGRGLESLEILRIPVADFALVYLFAAIGWTPWLIHKALQHKRPA